MADVTESSSTPAEQVRVYPVVLDSNMNVVLYLDTVGIPLTAWQHPIGRHHFAPPCRHTFPIPADLDSSLSIGMQVVGWSGEVILTKDWREYAWPGGEYTLELWNYDQPEKGTRP